MTGSTLSILQAPGAGGKRGGEAQLRNGICKLVPCRAETRIGPRCKPAGQPGTECSQTEISNEFLARKNLHCVQVYEEKICLINSSRVHSRSERLP